MPEAGKPRDELWLESLLLENQQRLSADLEELLLPLYASCFVERTQNDKRQVACIFSDRLAPPVRNRYKPRVLRFNFRMDDEDDGVDHPFDVWRHTADRSFECSYGGASLGGAFMLRLRVTRPTKAKPDCRTSAKLCFEVGRVDGGRDHDDRLRMSIADLAVALEQLDWVDTV